jgi:hypothetical protein
MWSEGETVSPCGLIQRAAGTPPRLRCPEATRRGSIDVVQRPWTGPAEWNGDARCGWSTGEAWILMKVAIHVTAVLSGPWVSCRS